MGMKNIKEFIELVELRMKLMLMLAPIAIMIIGAQWLKLNQFEQLKAIIPKPIWIERSISVLDISFKLWNTFGFLFLLVTLTWWGIRILVNVVGLGKQESWQNSVLKSAFYILESSIWWSYLFSAKVLFLNFELSHFYDDLLLSVPVTAFAALYVLQWFNKDTVNGNARNNTRQMGITN